MRQFRFRGKSVKDGEWVEGYFAILHIAMEGTHGEKVGFKEVPSIFCDEPGERDKGGYWHEIVPETLSPFTGFRDCGGRCIYEGDIIEKQAYPHAGRKRTVVWNERGFWCSEEPEGHAIDTVPACDMFRCWGVIGNRWDMPGLTMED